jgi:hypothetical protein
MILECFRTGTGIRFRKGSLRRIGMNQDALESFTGGQFIIERVRSEMLASEDTLASVVHLGGLCQDDDLNDTDIDPGSLDSVGKISGLSITIKEVSASTMTVAFKPGPEQERKDALCPIYDQLDIWKVWRLPEFLSIRHRLQSPDRSLQPEEHY